MSNRKNSVGWEMLKGHTWSVSPNLVPAVTTVSEALNNIHQDPGLAQDNTDEWLLLRFFSKGTRCRVGTGPWCEREPDIWNLYPGMTQWVQDTRAAQLPLHVICIQFTGGERVGLQRLVSPRLGFVQFRDPSNLLLQHVRGMASIADARRDDGYFDVMSGLMSVVGILLKAAPVDDGLYEIGRTGQAPLNDPLILRVRAYLAAHYHENLTGTQMKTVLRLRLSKAKELLVAGHTIKEVAEQTGFYDAFHFSKVFKREEGIAPSRSVTRLSSSLRK
jgi:hypothetical protein